MVPIMGPLFFSNLKGHEQYKRCK